jgi:hypothetical protein
MPAETSWSSSRTPKPSPWPARRPPAPRHGDSDQRGRGGDEAGDDGEGEGDVESVAEGSGDQVWEEAGAGEYGMGVGRQRGQRFGANQVLDRVVAEEGGEEDRDRRRLATPICRPAGTLSA